MDFIRRHKGEPFFLYLPHFGVHSPWQAKKELIEKFAPKPAAGGHSNPTCAAMIDSVDQSVGRVMAVLDELGLSDKTVLIFSSDNGGVGGYSREDGLISDRAATQGRGKAGKGSGKQFITDNAPLRSGKGSLYEGGTRDPFVVRWPGHVPAGSLCAVSAIHVDIYPTLLEVAGATPPANYPLDGESLVPLFRDGNAHLRRDAIYQHFPGYLGAGPGLWRTTPVATIISGDWKLMEYMEDKHLELYNLRDDIGEKKNLATARADKAHDLQARLHTWQASIHAPMPTANTDVKPAVPAGGKGKGRRREKAE